MPHHEELLRGLRRAGLGDWCEPLLPLLRERLDGDVHGDAGKWRDVIGKLPDAGYAGTRLDTPAVTAESPSRDPAQISEIRELLGHLSPWRKGPFCIHGVDIDSEWRSDLKWDRLAKKVSPLAGRRVLDVGCGNGYYAFRMIGAGANLVIGIDPTVLFVFQFLALNRFLRVPSVQVLPLRLDELPDPGPRFDTTFSMGVLYHQREPLEHLAALRRTLRPGGELVLETLVLPGGDEVVLEPEKRYARMRNVWYLPGIGALEAWLDRAGFRDWKLADVSVTTTEEQRTTAWMPFESLGEALDPADPGRTVEGLPAPTRAVLIARSPHGSARRPGAT